MPRRRMLPGAADGAPGWVVAGRLRLTHGPLSADVSTDPAPRGAKRRAVLARLGPVEVGVAIAALILVGAVGAALAAERARKKDTPAVGDPYEALYPGRHERRAPLRRDGSGLPRGEGAGHPRRDR
jgi:hypothetical protein